MHPAGVPVASNVAGWEHFAHDADIGLRCFGRTMAEAFEQSAVALTAIVTEAPVVPGQEVSVSCVNAVVLAVEQAGLASRVARLRPLICIKG